VLNQDTTSPDFQKLMPISVGGKQYHGSRAVSVMNEDPIYISFTTSAFGFVGRSVYQRALYPLQSFVWSMVTDNLVQRKAGLLVAKTRQGGSISDRLMSKAAQVKRNFSRRPRRPCLSIEIDESIETLNMNNLEGRRDGKEEHHQQCAASDEIPYQVLMEDTLEKGLGGDGSEDAAIIADYVESVRERWTTCIISSQRLCSAWRGTRVLRNG